MIEDLVHISIAAVILLSGVIAFQQFRIARLHRKLENLLTGELFKAASQAAPVESRPLPGAEELTALKVRIEVLERIATDPSDRLGQELDALRSIG
jgi:hypothetical protein